MKRDVGFIQLHNLNDPELIVGSLRYLGETNHFGEKRLAGVKVDEIHTIPRAELVAGQIFGVASNNPENNAKQASPSTQPESVLSCQDCDTNLESVYVQVLGIFVEAIGGAGKVLIASVECNSMTSKELHKHVTQAFDWVIEAGLKLKLFGFDGCSVCVLSVTGAVGGNTSIHIVTRLLSYEQVNKGVVLLLQGAKAFNDCAHFFKYKGYTVFIMPDFVHAFKNVRNNLISRQVL